MDDLAFSSYIVIMLLVSPLGWIYYFPFLLIPLTAIWKGSHLLGGGGSFRTLAVLAWLLSTMPKTLVKPDDLGGDPPRRDVPGDGMPVELVLERTTGAGPGPALVEEVHSVRPGGIVVRPEGQAQRQPREARRRANSPHRVSPRVGGERVVLALDQNLRDRCSARRREHRGREGGAGAIGQGAGAGPDR